MKKTNLWNNLLSTTARKAIASVLALSMVLSGAVYATGTSKTGSIADAAADATTFINGDVDANGKVDLTDAQIALKAALKITELTEAEFYAADVDSDNDVDLTDAQLILKAALKIKDLPYKQPPVTATEEPPVVTGPGATEPGESEVPTSTPTPTPPPRPVIPTGAPPVSFTPRPSLEPVEAKEENVVVSYQALEVANKGAGLNMAQVVTAESVNGRVINQYVFGPKTVEDVTIGAISAAGLTVEPKDLVSLDGIEMKNPFAGRTDLIQTPAEVIRTERVNDKPTVWELTGACIDVLTGEALVAQKDVHVSNAEPKGHKYCDQETYDYTIPQWEKGMSYSFWVNTESVTDGDPIFTMVNDTFVFSVKANGTVRFLDGLSTKKRNSLYLRSDQIVGGFEGWAHYTITIKNDWVQVYVNGQENCYIGVSMSRGEIGYFNDGFMTRYNPIAVVTEEDVKQDVRQFYTTRDQSSNHTPWELAAKTDDTNTPILDEDGNEIMEYQGSDDFSIFVNGRFGGKQKGSPLLMDLLVDDTTQVFIGGYDGTMEVEHTARQFSMHSNVADLKAYDVELTPEQVAACYEYDTVTPEAIKWELGKVVDKGGDDEEVVVSTDGALKPIQVVKVNNWAEYDETKDVITFKALSGPVTRRMGVEVENPFVGKEELRATLEDALAGQTLFPYLAAFGGTIERAESDGPGCSSYGVQVMRGNFYDVWYGDPSLAGNEMNPPTGPGKTDGAASELMSIEALEETYGDQKVEYHRPKWTNGVSFSFWAKPVEVDDSPLVTFYKMDNICLVISVQGDVCYYSLAGDDWAKQTQGPTNTPYNSFSAMGDPSYVKAGEWNYYTITIANDWIQVYVNGKEMVYSMVNLAKTYSKYFNKSYLTRYNTIGVWTTDMIAKYGDPSGKTLEGTERNYVSKTGVLYDLTYTDIYEHTDGTLHSCLGYEGHNKGNEDLSIRATGVYSNPINKLNGTLNNGHLVIDLMTDSKVQMYFGGKASVISEASKYTFQLLRVTPEQAADEEYKAKNHFVEASYYTDAETGEITGETSTSRCKLFFSDHIIDEGTQVSGMNSYTKELTAEEVKAQYESALPYMPE